MLAAMLLAACSEEQTHRVTPKLQVEPRALDFGLIQPGQTAERTVSLRAMTQAPVAITRLAVAGEAVAPFAVLDAVETIDADGEAAVRVRFAPTAAGDFSARLEIDSDDPDADAPRAVALSGRAATPRIRVEASCETPCALFTATATPAAIDFGARRPLRRGAGGVILDEPVWPTVTIFNDGEVPLVLRAIRFDGDAAFRAASEQALPSGEVELAPGSGQQLQISFDPVATQASYSGALVIESDDPERGEQRVALSGALAPDSPPTVCAAIVQVDQPDGSVEVPRDAAGQPSFSGTPPPVQPGKQARVYLSAFSDHFVPGLHPDERTRGDAALCTGDAYDGRALTYRWTLLEKPPESAAALQSAQTPEPTLQPDAIGRYAVRLEVTDGDGNRVHADVAFEAMPRRDLVAQLSWGERNVDLDLHLVRPGACGGGGCLFDAAGDLNGYSTRSSAGFDWGVVGQDADDPRLDFDDRGDRALLETITLDRPENDPVCQAGDCSYEVYVHYFEDWRPDSPRMPACPGLPCLEGDACGCAGGAVCVSERCVAPARPEVKLFVRPQPGSPPALTLPLPTEQFAVAGPCFLWHLASIDWPAGGTPQVREVGSAAAREVAYYGQLAPGSFACEPNTDPALPPGYVPGTVPRYQ